MPKAKISKKKPGAQRVLLHYARSSITNVLIDFQTAKTGLTHEAVLERREKYGPNEVVHERRQSWFIRFLKTIYNPLVILLLLLSGISYATGDLRSAVIIALMVLISVLIRFFQENRASVAAARLKAMVKTTCTVRRDGKKQEISLYDVVPGDIILLSAGDIIPADVRLIMSKELFLNESALTGETLPAEKHATRQLADDEHNILAAPNICFLGTHVENGTATAVAIATGSATYFGRLAQTITGTNTATSFDKGIARFTWLMIWCMAIMVPCVFLVNGLSKGDWWQAFLFSVAVAVGLTPEMLPAIVTVNLTKGALAMAKKKVIIKKLSAIQNFGAMDILCTDKTGTLTQNKVVLVKNIDIHGHNNHEVLHYAYANSFYQTGFKNLLDDAVVQFARHHKLKEVETDYEKLDELPFDFARRRMSVIVADKAQHTHLFCKGAVEEVTDICQYYTLNGETKKLGPEARAQIAQLHQNLSQEGFRVIAVAAKKIPSTQTEYSVKDETDLTLAGFMAFFDPPKESAAEAIRELRSDGVMIKVLTGDNELVTQKICDEVGLPVERIILGPAIEVMTDTELDRVVEDTTIFAKLAPMHKMRVVEALQRRRHVVGFLGDGINDAPGLKAADVGISVNSAVDIARESADIVLLEMSLLVLKDGVIEGRKVFGNIMKYIKMGASSNFGNMFSMLGASIFLPFLPMLPVQILLNNLLYDVSQTAIPTDKLDKEFLRAPRKWDTGNIRRFMFMIGPISSLFDYVTFFVLLYVFHAWQNAPLFQTAWFVESLLTQTLIIHVIRSKKIPFIQTRASIPLMAATGIIMVVGVAITYAPFGASLGFVHLPFVFWPILFLILLAYMSLTQFVKIRYFMKYGYN